MINIRQISTVWIIKEIRVYIALHSVAIKKRLFCCYKMELTRAYGIIWVEIHFTSPSSSFSLKNIFNYFSGYYKSAGQTALTLARDSRMIQILSVKSARKVEKTVNRLEGTLLRRSRFLGWRSVWVTILQSCSKRDNNKLAISH